MKYKNAGFQDRIDDMRCCPGFHGCEHRTGTMKGILFAAILAFFCMGTGISPIVRVASAEVVDRIVAVINDDIILLTELAHELQPYIQRIKANDYPVGQEEQIMFKVRTDLLNQMIDQKLTDQEAVRSHIVVSEKEIDNRIERLKETNYFTDEELRQMLAEKGLTLESYRQSIKEQILRARLVDIEVKSKIVITKEDIQAYYRAHPEKYGGEKKYHLRNLMIPISSDAPATDRRDARERMDGIYAKLVAGQPYDSTGTRGMDLGLIGFSNLSTQLKGELEKLKSGEFTPVLDTDQGYQIFFVESIETGSEKTQEDAFEEIERELYEEVINEKFSTWLDELRERSHIKVIQ